MCDKFFVDRNWLLLSYKSARPNTKAAYIVGAYIVGAYKIFIE